MSTADRLRGIAMQALQRGRLGDATRATLAEARTLRLLWDIELTGQTEADYAADVAAMERAVGVLIRRAPAGGDVIAKELASQGRDRYAAIVRDLTERVRHERQEITIDAQP